jgi:hypothetical protein
MVMHSINDAIRIHIQPDTATDAAAPVGGRGVPPGAFRERRVCIQAMILPEKPVCVSGVR